MVLLMTESLSSEVLAVDGGGTRCRVALSDGSRVVSVETGSANVSTDMAGGVQEILRGLGGLAERLGRPVETLHTLPAFVGLAGVTGDDVAERLRAALPLARVRIEDDRPAALRGALGERPGAVAHCGTGSFFASKIDGQVRLAGGWGPVLGDEASAQWLGRVALGLTLETVDGIRDPSGLSDLFLSEYGGSAGIVRFAGRARPSDIGGLARAVTEHAGTGDALARAAMQAGADHIARALPLIGWVQGLAICLTGGLGPHFASYLPGDMQADLAEPEGVPLDGALALAREFAKESAHVRG